jgi:hypothetical protein
MWLPNDFFLYLTEKLNGLVTFLSHPCFTSMQSFCVVIAFLACCPVIARAGAYTPDPSLGDPDRRSHLYDIGRRYLDTNFDPAANLVGAPSNNPPNTGHHSVGASMSYVTTLLTTDDANDHARAQAILKNILGLQDTKPDSATYGCFRRMSEDPAPDPNSPNFIGLELAGVLDRDRKHSFLDPDLRKQTEQAFRLTVDAVMRRDVDPGVTSSALTSVAVAAAGAKLFSIPKADAFAEAKLDAVIAQAGDNGEFAEYLSTTALSVSLEGAYAARTFSFSDNFGKKADTVINRLWKQIAADYHAPTCQLAGPFTRSYGENMLYYASGLKYWLSLALPDGYPLPDTETDHDWDKAGVAELAAMPVSTRAEFKDKPPAWREWDASASKSTLARHFSQFREGNFILSTVATQDQWKLKRNVVAYWRNDGSSPDDFTVGYCLDESNESLPDGAPFGQLHFFSRQKNGAVLVALATSVDVPTAGGCSLIFDKGATLGDTNATRMRVVDGTMTAYLYPVSTGTPSWTMENTDHGVNVARDWSTADTVGTRHIIAYLAVFRATGQPEPAVSELMLQADGDNATASGKVDGTELSLPALH